MTIDSLINLLVEYSDNLITWGIALLLLLAAMVLAWPRLYSGYLDRQLHKKIQAVAAEALHQVVIPDGMDGAVYLENLLLTPDGLLVLPVHRYKGVVFAADGIDNWTQVLGKRTYKFGNPLPQLESEVLAVKDYAAGIPVKGRVVFTKGVEFPKGRPEKLISVAELEKLGEDNRQREVPAAYWQAWGALKQRVQTPEVSKLRQLYAVEKETAFNGRSVMAGVMFLAAGAWLGWRYLLV
ncbi:nuclease-related domain-containing protein [Thiohalophilus sp.]|uniref:nuclease-related domain-containing protein n=1 Tax=Thiohalophilus sp. TaxID=3028392 RepID=UPI002ACDCB66|nr:nuclease-related domain-containing protein [Thiohalophilus sp.]MDZ7804105.1 nuclease-related domain-containing protein [Thiohalophilus sp.]